MKEVPTEPRAAEESLRKKRLFAAKADRLLIALTILMGVVFLVAGLCVIAFVYPFETPFRYCMGILLGCGSNIVKVILIGKSLEKTLDMNAKQAKTREKLHATGRYFVTVAAVAAAVVFRDIFGVVGLILGILVLRFAAQIAGRFSMRGDKYDAKGRKI